VPLNELTSAPHFVSSRLFRRLPCPPRQHRQLSQRVLLHYHRMTPPPPPRLRLVRLSPAIIIMAEDLPHLSTCEFMASFPGTRCYLLFAHGQRSFTRPAYPTPFAINYHRFTFLATLFLLLFVSSAIILRSFVLRRRFRRRIEEAILAGVIAPPHTRRTSRRRAIGEKPKLWEARVAHASDDGWHAIIVRLRPHFSFPSSLFSSHHLSSRDLPPSSPVSFERIFVLTFDVCTRWRFVAEVGSL